MTKQVSQVRQMPPCISNHGEIKFRTLLFCIIDCFISVEISKNICPLESISNLLQNLSNRDFLAQFVQKLCTYKHKRYKFPLCIMKQSDCQSEFKYTQLLNKLSKKVLVAQVLKQIEIPFKPEQLENSVLIRLGLVYI